MFVKIGTPILYKWYFLLENAKVQRFFIFVLFLRRKKIKDFQQRLVLIELGL